MGRDGGQGGVEGGRNVSVLGREGKGRIQKTLCREGGKEGGRKERKKVQENEREEETDKREEGRGKKGRNAGRGIVREVLLL